MTRRTSIIAPLLILALVGGYVGAYYGMVDREFWVFGRPVAGYPFQSWWPGEATHVPSYRLGGWAAVRAFSPVHLVDRYLRREYWDPYFGSMEMTDEPPR